MKNNPNFEENLSKLKPTSKKRQAELEKIEREALANYYGNIGELSKAIGMLHLGDHIGWRVLVLIHNKRTIRKYEDILKISIKDFFPEEGPAAGRSIGYRAAIAIGNFWKVVSGEKKVDNKTEME